MFQERPKPYKLKPGNPTSDDLEIPEFPYHSTAYSVGVDGSGINIEAFALEMWVCNGT
jgi:hypothetical protein